MIERTGYNNIVVQAYDASENPIQDPEGAQRKMSGIQFATGYPGGLCLDASGFVPKDVLNKWAMNKANRVVLRNSTKDVYEGWIADNITSVSPGTQGMGINLTGGFAKFLMPRHSLLKRWADNRLDGDRYGIWDYDPDSTDASRVEFSRGDTGFKFLADYDQTWGNGDYVEIIYTMPTGQTVKRVSFSYNFSIGDATASSWTVLLQELDTPSTEWNDTQTTTGDYSGTPNVTLATPANQIAFRLRSDAAQTRSSPPSGGIIWFQVYNLVVYSETGNINMETVAGDIIDANSDLSTSTAAIDAAGSPLNLTSFIKESGESMAEILDSITSRGDAAFNRWAAYIKISSTVASNTKPVLAVSQFPALTDYDYQIDYGDETLVGELRWSKDYLSIRNYIIVFWRDHRGKINVRTPDDDAALKDTTSIGDYRQQDEVINVNSRVRRGYVGLGTPDVRTISLEYPYADAATALNAGKTFLARMKDPQVRVDAPITVRGYIRSKQGNPVPACEIQAGKRVKLQNYHDEVILLITRTLYDDDTETCQMQFGSLDMLLPMGAIVRTQPYTSMGLPPQDPPAPTRREVPGMPTERSVPGMPTERG